MASAQVKSAILLAGLFADGETEVIEPAASRDHTERMLRLFGIEVTHAPYLVSDQKRTSCSPLATRSVATGHYSSWRSALRGGQKLRAVDFTVPGDISSAAFWLAAAAALPGGRVRIRNVGLNPTRTGILEVLARMGAKVETAIERNADSEPSGTVTVTGQTLRGIEISGSLIANIIDELPVIAVAAALAQGDTVISDAAELRTKESDRIAAVAANLRSMGARVEERPDGMTIHGGTPLHGATLPSYGDHRIAMAFAIAGLFANGQTVIENSECIGISYPGFEAEVRALAINIGSQARCLDSPT